MMHLCPHECTPGCGKHERNGVVEGVGPLSGAFTEFLSASRSTARRAHSTARGCKLGIVAKSNGANEWQSDMLVIGLTEMT